MQFLRKLAWVLFILLLGVFLLTGVLTPLYFYVPSYLETKVLPKIAKQAGLSDFACSVRRVGLWGADLSDVRMGPATKPSLLLESVQVDYNPIGLLQKRVDKVLLNGIEIHGQYRNGELVFAGAPKGQSVKDIREELRSRLSKPIPVEHVEIHNGVVHLDWDGRVLKIPFHFRVDQTHDVWKNLACTLKLFVGDQEILLDAHVHTQRDEVSLKVKGELLQLQDFCSVLRPHWDLDVNGRANVDVKAILKINPLSVASLIATCEFDQAQLALGSLKIGSHRISSQAAPLSRIEIVSKGPNQWDVTVSDMVLDAQALIDVPTLHCILSQHQDSIICTGDFVTSLTNSRRLSQWSVSLQESVRKRGRFKCKIRKGVGTWDANISSIDQDDLAYCHFEMSGLQCRSRLPAFDITVKRTSIQTQVKYQIQVPDLSAHTDSLYLHVPSLVFGGRVVQKGVNKTTQNAFVEINKGVWQDSSLAIQATHIYARVPVAPSELPTGARGKIRVGQLQWKGMRLKGIQGSVRKTKTGIDATIDHTSTLVPGLHVVFTAQVRLGELGRRASADLNLKAEYTNSETGLAVAHFLPVPDRTMLCGQLGVGCQWSITQAQTAGSMQVRLRNGQFKVDNRKMLITGIRADLVVPDLTTMRSNPLQPIRFGAAKLGQLQTGSGQIDFEVESPTSLFIEQAKCHWCGGQVWTQAVRIDPNRSGLDLTLNCDGLDLAGILAQFGAADATGEGKVDGRIPVRIVDGRVVFQHGYLLSVPGQGGKIQLKNTELFTVDIPKQTARHGQIELAREALRDYDYKWAKLTLNSEGETLLLRLQLDGKPAGRLPFVYKKEAGGFVKAKQGSKGMKFRGISLDVNFRLPLDKILQYRYILSKIK